MKRLLVSIAVALAFVGCTREDYAEPQNVTSSLKTILRPTKGITPFCVYGKTPMIILCTLLLIYTFYTNRKLKKQNKLS